MGNISQITLPGGTTYDVKDGNAVASVTESKGVVTVTKRNGTTSNFNVITSHQNISGLAPKASPALTGTPTAPTAAAGTNNTQIATTAFVMNAFTANDAMVFKGTIGSSGATVTALPNTHYQGWTYRVITAGTYAGKACEIGDMIICVTDGTAANNDHWTVVQTNIDGAVTGPASSTDAHVAVFYGTSGKVIKDSGFTIGKSVPSNAVFTDTDTKVTSASNHYAPATVSGQDKTASASGATAAWGIDIVKGVTLNTDGKGHVTGLSVTSGKIPNNPNTNTTYTLTQDANDGHKITLTPSSGNATTITIPDSDTKYTASTTTVGSASAGTAIAADDITAWTTNTPTVVTKKTVVTGGSTTDVPNISKKTVVTSASGATAAYANGVLTITNGSFSTGDSVTVGTAIKAYTSLTTGDSVDVTAGTAASLSYTARSIPNISVSNKTVATGISAS